ncbi:MAG: hypothetical protein KU37_03390 [Sulfuricurvum sp. PC08-66]|nr:MAG: hypothetical protein KU37_03390 [Sulfuricurvum sp. PC08-66]
MRRSLKSALLLSTVMLSLAQAEDNTTAANVEVLSNVEVVDKSLFRNRTNSVKPVLTYDSGFFDKYEPRTVGEMLKFLPGVAFQGDVGEYDYVKLRGMASGYTQILINGNRVPGTEADGSASLDLIPAEMVERIEIIRSSSASNDSAGMAGTINIILKEATSTAKFAYRLGTSYHSNGKGGTNGKKDVQDGSDGTALYGDVPVTYDKFKGFGYFSYTDMIGKAAFTLSANIDDRYNAKDKITQIFEADKTTKKAYENEYDNRDTLTTSLYAKVVTPLLGNDELTVSTNYFGVVRREEQREIAYEHNSTAWVFDEIQHQIMDINKNAINVQAEYEFSLNDTHRINFFNAFDTLTYSLRDYEAKKGSNLAEVDDILAWTKSLSDDKTTTNDVQYNAKLTDTFNPTSNSEFIVGVDYLNKNRDTTQTFRTLKGTTETNSTGDLGTYKVVQNRMDGFVEGNFKIDEYQTIGAGGRFEGTHTVSTSQAGVVNTNLYYTISPSVHYVANVSAGDTLRASFAQTVKRPNMDQIVPFSETDEPREDDKLIGNPALKPEIAQGLDVGYEHAFEDSGVIGVNAYYRNIKDVIENSPTGNASGINSGKEYIVSNNGDALLYGIELDSSFPLSFIGLPELSIFANYAYLGSRVTDFFTGKLRRFNDQPEYVYNLGFNHDIKKLGFSYGLNWQQRGQSTAESATTTEVTTYGANVEIFAEYNVLKDMKLRLTIDNLLDSSVHEAFTNYASVSDKIAGTIDEYETQIERAGARYMLTLSGAF